MEISSSTFIDFVTKSGTSKITCVRRAKEQYGLPYEVCKDYWLPLRQTIIKMHTNSLSATELDSLVSTVHSRKVDNYRACIKGYKRWMRGKHFTNWIGSSASVWSSNGLDVRVNPELTMSVDGQPMVVKMYFKADRITASRLSTVLHLLSSTVAAPGVGVGVLDVRRGTLHTAGPAVPGIAALLAGEAQTFINIWATV